MPWADALEVPRTVAGARAAGGGATLRERSRVLHRMATVREATLELFRAHGMTTIFGNPGSTELPMLREPSG